ERVVEDDADYAEVREELDVVVVRVGGERAHVAVLVDAVPEHWLALEHLEAVVDERAALGGLPALEGHLEPLDERDLGYRLREGPAVRERGPDGHGRRQQRDGGA